VPLRQAGAQLIQDLHPHDRGPHGTHHGAIIANGNLYCPAIPRPLLEIGPLATLLVARNQRIIAAYASRHDDNARRARAGQPPKTRRRRRKTLATLAATPP
jgi:hypothetical protein